MKKGSENQEQSIWYLLGVVGHVGYIIAIPIVLFAISGRLVDKHLDTSPLFILVGIGLSITISTIWLTRKIKDILGYNDSRRDN